jgi:hypothetical protein
LVAVEQSELGIALVRWQVQSSSQTVTVTIGPPVMRAGSMVAFVAGIDVVDVVGMLMLRDGTELVGVFDPPHGTAPAGTMTCNRGENAGVGCVLDCKRANA